MPLKKVATATDDYTGGKPPLTEKGTTGATPITQSLGSRSLLELEER